MTVVPMAASWPVLKAALLCTVFGLIELGFLKGTDGPNRFGPDPLA